MAFDDNISVNNDSIRAVQEQDLRDREATEAFLFDVRCGGKPEILYDPVTGWELYMEGHRVIFSLDGSKSAVNMILRALIFEYRYQCALLGDTNKNRERLRVIN